MEIYKNYYAIIPATVRYDQDISSSAKLLYAEITALCNEKGYCWATNSYFCDLYGISDRQVRNLLKQLADKHYIKIVIEQKTKRRIFVLDTPELYFRGGRKKISAPVEENFLHNNKNNNINEYLEENVQSNYDWLNNE